MTWEELVESALEFFENNTDEFNYTIEELDSCNGYLDGQRREDMSCIDDFFIDSTPRDIIEAALNGKSEYGHYFDPDADFFYWDWNQLVSTNNYDYSDWLDKYFIGNLYNTYIRNIKRGWSAFMDLPSYIKSIFDDYFAEHKDNAEE